MTITVQAVNDAPTAAADSYTLDEDTTLILPAPGVLGNDADVEGDALSAVVVSDVSHGSLTLNADGSIIYTPNANYHGADSFTYRVNDGTLDSADAVVTITVNSVNDAPLAASDTYATDEDTALTVAAAGVLGNDNDADGDALHAALVAGTTNGSLTLSADGSFTYTPNANFNGSDSFTYKANDGAADSNIVTVTITVNPVNDPPTGVADSYSTDEDTALTVAAPGVLANDTDLEGDPLTAALVSGPSHGTLTPNPDGSFAYTPAADFNGTDSFTYKASDGTALSGETTVTITVNPVNDAPVAAADAYSTDEDTVLNFAAPGVLANDSDVDSSMTAVLVNGTMHGHLALAADGSFVYTPDANYNGIDTFTYRAGTCLSRMMTCSAPRKTRC
ncbi:MAG: hypothetical protein DMF88_15440 [Acidobacteria bacterium]|nr:MAG: hypothetical protein DMF88_15440 [Acidobacteriota bacterium]